MYKKKTHFRLLIEASKGSWLLKVNLLTNKSLFDFRSLCCRIVGNFVDQIAGKKNLMK